MKNGLFLIIIIVISLGVLGFSIFSLLGFLKATQVFEFPKVSFGKIGTFFRAELRGFLRSPANKEKYEASQEAVSSTPSSTSSASSASTPPGPQTTAQISTNIPGTPPNTSSTTTPIFSPPLIETYIISGPKNGDVIKDTDEVSFQFGANLFYGGDESQIFYETKVEGLDRDWQRNYSNKRTINFPGGAKEYTFLVRAKTQELTDLTPASRTFKINLSPHFEKVKIYNVQVQGYPSYVPLITLGTYFYGSEEKINISGWRLETQKGSFTIPQGIEKYNQASGSFPQDIFVKSGDTIYFSSDANPLGRNNNFRPNKCFGYLTNYYNFSIYFYKNCPKPEEEDILYLRPLCQQYIQERNYCEIPRYWEDTRVTADGECISFINNYFNYAPCFDRYQKDSDFLKNEWHIYMERDIIKRGLDILYLRDQNGFLVDKYLYNGSTY